MSAYSLAAVQLPKMLTALKGWIDKAEAMAKERDFDVDNFFAQRLAVDQFTFAKQVCAACDSAKFAAYRLAGVAAPTHADDETTVAELRARIDKAIACIEELEASQFEGGDERLIALGFLPDNKRVRGADYLREFALPNFYFHLTHAYAILRQSGVPLGKRDFIASLTLQDA